MHDLAKSAEEGENKTQRQAALLELVRDGAYQTQVQLAEALVRAGIPATATSVCRDVRELGLRKERGTWRPGPSLPGRLGTGPWSAIIGVAASGPHLIVVRVTLGSAQAVARALDHAALDGVVGTVAGVDTFFVATAGRRITSRLAGLLRAMVGLSLVLLALAGCGAPAPSDGESASGTLRIEPADAVVTVVDGRPASLEYRAILVSEAGVERDVTSDTSFRAADAGLGAFSGARFTSGTERGGRTTVEASARGLSAETSLRVRLQVLVVEEGAGEGAPGAFGGSVDPTRAPSIVYPADGVLVPPNLRVLEVQFLAGSGNSLFELALRTDAHEVLVYLPCAPLASGCAYTLGQDLWDLLVADARGGEAVSYALRGTGSTGSVGESGDRRLLVAEEDLEGGVYYWNAGAGAIRRVDFGRPSQTIETYLDAATAGASDCVGCHALSRDGTRIAVGLDSPVDTSYRVLDVATRTTLYAGAAEAGEGGAFFTFSPDASEVMTSDGQTITWRDAATGATIGDLALEGTMPDWSPSGDRLVYARSHPMECPPSLPDCDPIGGGGPGATQASLEVVSFDGAAWSAPSTLVPYEGANNFYPAFSPDGRWVAFNRSEAVSSLLTMDASLWLVGAEGGSPVRLAAIDAGGASWAKWAPQVQVYRAGTLLWLIFSSVRPVGLRNGDGHVQLWMTAIDPARAEGGEDPSYPVFWLPFQEPDSGNHIAQWVAEVVRQPCFDDSDCAGGEACESGVCQPIEE